MWRESSRVRRRLLLLLLAALEAQRAQAPEGPLPRPARELGDRARQRRVRRQPRVRQPLAGHGGRRVAGSQKGLDGGALVAAAVGGDDGVAHHLARDRADEPERRPRVQERGRQGEGRPGAGGGGGELPPQEGDLALPTGQDGPGVAGGLAAGSLRAAAGPAVGGVRGELQLREPGGDGGALPGGAGGEGALSCC